MTSKKANNKEVLKKDTNELVSFKLTRTDGKRAVYRREHKRRLSTKQFNNFVETINSYNFVNDKIAYLTTKLFQKDLKLKW